MARGAVKLTISVPQSLLAIADEVAAEQSISRSRVVAACLQELAKKRLQGKMQAGYKALARNNQRFAEGSLAAAREVISGTE
jgi:metal-responsive CopG/Arc/MetJ family transcriptional regulator